MRRFLPVAMVLILAAAPLAARAQTASDAGQKNARQARATLDAMVQALGGQAWLKVKIRCGRGTWPPFFMESLPAELRSIGVPRLA